MEKKSIKEKVVSFFFDVKQEKNNNEIAVLVMIMMLDNGHYHYYYSSFLLSIPIISKLRSRSMVLKSADDFDSHLCQVSKE